MDTYAADLAALVEALDLRDIILVGHSTGGGEVVRFAARHGAGRVAKIATAGAVPPVMVKSDSNPEGPSPPAWRSRWAARRAQDVESRCSARIVRWVARASACRCRPSAVTAT